MANSSNAGPLHKVQLKQGLGKSTLISPSISIPMPPGAASPRPPAAGQGQGQGVQATGGQNASGGNRNG